MKQLESNKQAFILLTIGLGFSFIGWNLLIANRLMLSIPLILIATVAVALTSIRTSYYFDNNPISVVFSNPNRKPYGYFPKDGLRTKLTYSIGNIVGIFLVVLALIFTFISLLIFSGNPPFFTAWGAFFCSIVFAMWRIWNEIMASVCAAAFHVEIDTNLKKSFCW